jgi:hypothetical protein
MYNINKVQGICRQEGAYTAATGPTALSVHQLVSCNRIVSIFNVLIVDDSVFLLSSLLAPPPSPPLIQPLQWAHKVKARAQRTAHGHIGNVICPKNDNREKSF